MKFLNKLNMTRYIVTIRLFLLLLITQNFSCSSLQKDVYIENDLYRLILPHDFQKDSRFIIQHKDGKISREIRPDLYIAYLSENPNLTSGSVDGMKGVLAWSRDDKELEHNIFNLNGEDITASNADHKDYHLLFSYESNKYGKVQLEVFLPEGKEAPSFKMGIIPKENGWYSLGFKGIKPVKQEEVDFLYQPLTWSWKRFPSETCITEEAYCTTAGTFVNTNGYTEGIAPSPDMIPYRFAYSVHWNEKHKMWKSNLAPKGNSTFGLAIRNHEGMAQPMLFAPLLGGDRSYMRKGEPYSFTCKYFLVPGIG